MAGDSTCPRDATRWIETSEGVLSYAHLASLLAERVLRVQQELESGNYAAFALDDDLIRWLHAIFAQTPLCSCALCASDNRDLQPLVALRQERLTSTL